jgi:hypothetical protein
MQHRQWSGARKKQGAQTGRSFGQILPPKVSLAPGGEIASCKATELRG